MPKVSSQVKDGSGPAAVAVTAAAAAVTAAKPVLPKISNQGKTTVLSKIDGEKKTAVPISEPIQEDKISPIEKEIDEKIPGPKTEDKIQIIQTMVSKPEDQVEKAHNTIAMPKPAIVLGPDKTDTGFRPSVEQKPDTTNKEFGGDDDDNDDDGDIQDLDEIKKDIAKIMTKLDQAEVE